MNIYDVRLDDDRPACGMNWPPPLKNITRYLDVRFIFFLIEPAAHGFGYDFSVLTWLHPSMLKPNPSPGSNVCPGCTVN